jgi:2-polyprenyl-6-methoxyphenol hydroxylase-like FAD-dependent oxidoreductase
MDSEFDVVIVGARPAGSATALLLARAGLRVLVVDRARFPSDTLSTHQIQVPGGACLARMGLLDAVVASGAPAARRVRFDPGPAVLSGSYPAYQGVDAVYSPRRTVLDTILVDAARAAGAEILENFDADEIMTGDGRVTGIRGAERGSRTRSTFRAKLVVGADGKHSTVAAAVGARAYRMTAALSAGAYAYWEGLPLTGGEMYGRQHRMVGAWPTNDGLTITFVAVPQREFAAFHGDLEAGLLSTLDACGDLGERARSAKRVERIRATNDLPNTYRRPHGPGWALVGDAGLVMDPITGQGIGHALLDAESLATAVIQDGPGEKALAAHHARRDRATRPMYDFTRNLASFRPDPAGQILFRTIEGDQTRIDELLGAMTGSVSMRSYFSGRNLHRIVGTRKLLSIIAGQARRR